MANERAPGGDAIGVEVAYALTARQWLRTLSVPAGTKVRDALRLSRIVDECPEIDPQRCPVGVFGRVVDDDYVLADGDRIEIYRPLKVDPKEARRARASRQLG